MGETVMELGRNRFADAVRKVAEMAPSVSRGATKAGTALAVALALLALPVVQAQGLTPLDKNAITGATQASMTASNAARTARVQSELSQYYACGLLRVAKADLASYSERSGALKLKALANESLLGAQKPGPQTSFGQNVEGIATMAKTLAMAGLSTAVNSVLGTAETRAWSGKWTAELGSIRESLAESAQQARLSRDIHEIDAASSEIEDTYQGIGCSV
jgi:hypothetical protein